MHLVQSRTHTYTRTRRAHAWHEQACPDGNRFTPPSYVVAAATVRAVVLGAVVHPILSSTLLTGVSALPLQCVPFVSQLCVLRDERPLLLLQQAIQTVQLFALRADVFECRPGCGIRGSIGRPPHSGGRGSCGGGSRRLHPAVCVLGCERKRMGEKTMVEKYEISKNAHAPHACGFLILACTDPISSQMPIFRPPSRLLHGR